MKNIEKGRAIFFLIEIMGLSNAEVSRVMESKLTEQRIGQIHREFKKWVNEAVDNTKDK